METVDGAILKPKTKLIGGDTVREKSTEAEK